MVKCHFSGWATRNDLLCADGRTIRKDAFKDCDGLKVPLIYNHKHDDPNAVLGHALLENRDEGVYAYCTFNDTEQGATGKELVKHGDVRSLSIYANQLKQIGGDVVHGVIRELSLVLAGANPGAYIDFVMAQSEDGEDGFYANYDENVLTLYHSADSEEDNKEELEHSEKEESEVADEAKKDTSSEKEKTVKEIFDGFSEEEKTAVYAIVGMALEDDDDEDDDENVDDENEENIEHSEGGNNVMKENVFDKGTQKSTNVLSHSDQKAILDIAKSNNVGSFQTALKIYADNNSLQHDAVASGGFVQTGEGNISYLFPEYKDVKPGAPELLTNDQGWVDVVISKVHKSPISRIRTSHVDIRNIDALRAKGYVKGEKKKLTGNFSLVRRTTDPQTIYVKNAIHKDDITDITDFDYVKYLYDIDRMMYNEELATAIMFGDGREEGDEDKISPEHIRPIWTDDDLYTLHVDLDIASMTTELQGSETGANFGTNFIRAEALINKILYARENYKGSGTPDCFIHPHELNVMLLARDRNGRRIYSSKSELASALNVGNIYTVEQMNGKTRTTKDSKTKKLLCIIANLADYSLGSTKGGQVTHHTQFDIDFNQQKSLLEGRHSGALTKVYSAIAIEEDVTEAAG